VAWVLRLVKIDAEGEEQATDVMEIERPSDLADIADLGLTLAETKRLLAGLQQTIVAAHVRDHAVRRPACPRCGGVCRVKDYQDHVVATLFGQVTVRPPRFRCGACGGNESGIDWPSRCRSTPELDRLQAHLCALLTYRTAADLMEQMFLLDAANHPETLRRHTLKAGEALVECSAIQPETPASAIVVTLDSTFIRSCEDGERHLEVRVGNVETKAGSRQVFGAVAKADTAVEALIRRELNAVGRTEDTAVTAFTDGCPGRDLPKVPSGEVGWNGKARVRCILADAGVTTTPILDWFHIGMRLQHLKQIAGALSVDQPARMAAKAVIVAEVERLHWRIWNGKAKNAQKSIDRIRAACLISRVRRVGESPSRPRESCGPPCTRWMVISPARAPGWRIMPSGTARLRGLEPRSPKGRPISW
jgi:hypothetical protein